jgi:hypothetical protein
VFCGAAQSHMERTFAWLEKFRFFHCTDKDVGVAGIMVRFALSQACALAIYLELFWNYLEGGNSLIFLKKLQ